MRQRKPKYIDSQIVTQTEREEDNLKQLKMKLHKKKKDKMRRRKSERFNPGERKFPR